MKSFNSSRPSPALVLAALALVFAMVGTAIAGPDAISDKITKSKVKKISKKQINKAAPDLSVASADSANPIAFARVRANGTVDEGNSKNITSANVTLEATSAYCFRGLSFEFRGAQVTPDYAEALSENPGAQFAVGDPYDDCAGTNVQAEVATSEAGVYDPVGFYVIFYD
jgi:hypothetical protein